VKKPVEPPVPSSTLRALALATHRYGRNGILSVELPPGNETEIVRWADMFSDVRERDEPGKRQALLDALRAGRISSAEGRFIVELSRPSTVVVAADGSGDASRLDDALVAPPGATVCLLAGTHAVALDRGSGRGRLILGQGVDVTTIEGAAEGVILGFAPDGLVTLSDVTVKRTEGEGDVVRCWRGTIAVTRCRIVGARGNERSVGLDIGPGTSAQVTDTRFEENLYAGVHASGDAQLVVERCEFSGSERGVVVRGTERATIRGCTFTGVQIGVFAGEAAAPTVDGCRFVSCERAGILLGEQSGGVARGNTCLKGEVGIFVTHESKPTLEGNICAENLVSGILVHEDAVVTARGNTCKANQETGIRVVGRAQATLIANTCEDNKQVGIAFTESAVGAAQDNTCRRNGQFGIFTGGRAQPTLESNRCEANALAGMVFAEDAGGKGWGNSCSGNGQTGIAVIQSSHPILNGNRCERNGQSGISYGARASGTARENACSGNPTGILVMGDAAPTLEQNRCLDNEREAIRYAGNAAGVAKGNIVGSGGLVITESARPTVDAPDDRMQSK
jgi:parallel beta-helix repeat protein